MRNYLVIYKIWGKLFSDTVWVNDWEWLIFVVDKAIETVPELKSSEQVVWVIDINDKIKKVSLWLKRGNQINLWHWER